MLQSQLSIPLRNVKIGGMKVLGDMVRASREARGMRGIDLAYAIGRDASYVSRLERGTLKEIPDPATLGQLSQSLGIPILNLLRAIGYEIPAGPLPTYGDDRLRYVAENWHILTSERRDYLVWMIRHVRRDHGLDTADDDDEPVIAVNRVAR